MKLTYEIDRESVEVSVDDSTEFFRGRSICLSSDFDDLTASKPWYADGYTTLQSTEFFDFQEVKKGVSDAVKQIVQDESNAHDLEKFTLENYHKFVDKDLHSRVLKKTRRLFPKDFSFDEEKK